MVAQALAPNEVAIDYFPLGGARELWYARDRQVLIEGAAGTGKTIACLNRLHRACTKYAGMRALMVRKTAVSLKASALVTYQRKVLTPFDAVRFYGGSQAEPAKFIYPNGSEIIVGGMDQASKIMSTEYDMAYVNEATDLTEDDWESIDTRLRNYVMPYQQLIADCNPQAPTHWLNVRCDAGKTRRILSKHEDNPFYFDPKSGELTSEGRAYIAGLDQLTGVRYQRLRLGKWVAAEGQIYEGWDTAVHLVDRFPVPDDWPRYWDVDFGFTNPFVWHEWAMDPDGRLFGIDEIYRTQVLVEDHATNIMSRTAKRPRPRVVVTDHDAEDRATFERKTGLRTTAATKEVSPGIQAVASRLRAAQDGRPRLFLFRDACPYNERDRSLIERGKPSCTADEFPTYVWDTRQGVKKGEAPLKEDDHGMDALRYQVAFHDVRVKGKMWSFSS